MSKICLIKQPCGIGDIFYCLKIARVIQAATEYKKVIWPVASTYSYVGYYIDGIEFCTEEEPFPYKELYSSNILQIIQNEDVLYIPLQTSDRLMNKCLCHGDNFSSRVFGHIKYNFCGISYDDWLDYFEFKRDRPREDELFQKLGLDEKTPYNVVNRAYGTFPHFLTRDDIEPQNGYKNVEMHFYEGVTLFDWIKVLEVAAEIHTVETSLTYLLEKLGLKKVWAYSRYRNVLEDFSIIQTNNTKTWKYIH